MGGEAAHRIPRVRFTDKRLAEVAAAWAGYVAKQKVSRETLRERAHLKPTRRALLAWLQLTRAVALPRTWEAIRASRLAGRCLSKWSGIYLDRRRCWEHAYELRRKQRMRHFERWYRATRVTRVGERVELILKWSKLLSAFNWWKDLSSGRRKQRSLRCLFRLWKSLGRTSSRLSQLACRIKTARQRSITRRALHAWANSGTRYSEHAKRLVEFVTDRVILDWREIQRSTPPSHRPPHRLSRSLDDWQRLAGRLGDAAAWELCGTSKLLREFDEGPLAEALKCTREVYLMRNYANLCLWTIVSAAFLRPTPSPSSHLEFYKDLYYPWAVKEGPICFNQTLCPRYPNYTWDDYFEYLLDKGVKNFVFGGLMMVRSDIRFILEYNTTSRWNRTGFMPLKRRVQARGGRILGNMLDAQGMYGKPFNKTLFRNNVAKFAKHFPVDGFRIAEFLPYSGQTAEHVKEALEAINELGLISSIRLQPGKLDAFAKGKVGRIANTTFLSLWPRYNDNNDTAAFNTDRFAVQAILNASTAGVDPAKIVLEVPLLARSNYGSADVGYSMLIYVDHANPQGNGRWHNKYGGDYYFFSQPRAVKKIKLAHEHGLHGISLQASLAEQARADLFPWNNYSLFHAIVENM
ncbi:hypothetical protein FOZ63_018849 [Perkinsus olseni]|uniref:Uncharacterized protein n=1 Tax=Perkinsus olseni TaxID=32597 RepID=A0A7J6S6J4_PEROL|nr:hypothetical protein FOZ63_018849 [Perkinsus olseni]